MAHFAQIDSNNIVIQVIVVADSDCGGGQYPESDPIGDAFCNNLLGGTWKQTSYNNNFRKNYAGIGYTYDAQRDAFIPPQPFASWTLNEDTCLWEAPVAMPEDAGTEREDGTFITYRWDEDTVSWVLIEDE